MGGKRLSVIVARSGVESGCQSCCCHGVERTCCMSHSGTAVPGIKARGSSLFCFITVLGRAESLQMMSYFQLLLVECL